MLQMFGTMKRCLGYQKSVLPFWVEFFQRKMQKRKGNAFTIRHTVVLAFGYRTIILRHERSRQKKNKENIRL